MIARILVKQAAEKADRVNNQLIKILSRDGTLLFNPLVDILKNYNEIIARQSAMLVMFDGLDECNDEYFEEIVELIQNLKDSGIRVYATARDYSENVLCRLQSQPLIIEADIKDVEQYLIGRLERRKMVVTPEFREEIVKEITPGIDGMYFTLS